MVNNDSPLAIELWNLVFMEFNAEPGGKLISDFLGLRPLLYAGMHLGEATGAAMFLPMLDEAFALYDHLPGFAEGNVKQYEHLV